MERSEVSKRSQGIYHTGEGSSEPAQKRDAISVAHLFVSVFLLVPIKETILGGSIAPPEI